MPGDAVVDLTLPPQQQGIRAKCFHRTGAFVPFPRKALEESIPSRFEEQVRLYPDRVAVRCPTRVLSYDELNQEANRVAHAILARRGNGCEPVALLFDHGTDFIVAILGVLKAGKAYVPIDPTFPHARLAHLVEDARAGLIITDTRNLPLAQQLIHGTHEILNPEELEAGLSPENPVLSISPNDLAYIVYTSGSTGQPKGVMQTHRNGLHLVMVRTDDYHIGNEDRLASLYSPSTSGTTGGILSALLNGASVHPISLQGQSPRDVTSWLMDEKITVLSVVVSLFRRLMSNRGASDCFPAVRLLSLSGEAVAMRDVELYKLHFSEHCVLINALSATETGTFRRYCLDKATSPPESVVPAGYAVQDFLVSLLDDGVEVGEGGVVGEIAVRSRYLSPGYWRDPELTKAKFLADPDGGDARIYLTGDLGRLLPDGCLVHLGRKGFQQVKIRGHRVEVAEVEMALLDHEAIKEAAVMPWEAPSDDTRLVAYLVPFRKPGPTIGELRSFLQVRLPGYMVPSSFVTLDALPRTATGKVDRRALPPPEGTRPALATPYVAPRSPLEAWLAMTWAAVLGLDRVGVEDHFLDLGGDSLRATGLVSRVLAQFQVSLAPRILLDAPTVAAMAEVLLESLLGRTDKESLEQALAEIEALSEEEVRTWLNSESS